MDTGVRPEQRCVHVSLPKSGPTIAVSSNRSNCVWFSVREYLLADYCSQSNCWLNSPWESPQLNSTRRDTRTKNIDCPLRTGLDLHLQARVPSKWTQEISLCRQAKPMATVTSQLVAVSATGVIMVTKGDGSKWCLKSQYTQSLTIPAYYYKAFNCLRS